MAFKGDCLLRRLPSQLARTKRTNEAQQKGTPHSSSSVWDLLLAPPTLVLKTGAACGECATPTLRSPTLPALSPGSRSPGGRSSPGGFSSPGGRSSPGGFSSPGGRSSSPGGRSSPLRRKGTARKIPGQTGRQNATALTKTGALSAAQAPVHATPKELEWIVRIQNAFRGRLARGAMHQKRTHRRQATQRWTMMRANLNALVDQIKTSDDSTPTTPALVGAVSHKAKQLGEERFGPMLWSGTYKVGGKLAFVAVHRKDEEHLLLAAKYYVAGNQFEMAMGPSDWAEKKFGALATLGKERTEKLCERICLDLCDMEVDPGLLRRVPMFASLKDDAREAILSHVKRLNVGEKHTLCKQGTVGDEMFFIRRGQIEVMVNGQHVSTLHDDDFFGELAVMSATGMRTASLITRTRCELMTLHRDGFNDVLKRFPDFMKEMEAKKQYFHAVDTGRVERRRAGSIIRNA